MTYLTGETTFGDLAQKICNLAGGLEADSLGTTVPEAERWRVTPGVPHLGAPASQDLQLTQEHRAGYWTRFDDSCYLIDKTSSANTWMRTSQIFSAWHANFYELLVLSASVATANTVAGDYSTAIVRLRGYASGTPGAQPLLSTTVPVAANGTWSYTYSSGVTMQGQIGDPSGIVSVNTYFIRTFTSVYRGGIDCWRGFGRSLVAPTYSVAPAGVDGTDHSHTLGYAPSHPSYGDQSYVEYPKANVGGQTQTPPYLNGTYGLGIKTTAGLTGARYVVTFPKTDAQMRLYNTTSGLAFMPGGTGFDASAPTTRRWGLEGSTSTGMTLAVPFGSVPTATSRLQYWISVTPTHLAVVLNGDSANSGRIASFIIGKSSLPESADDPGCWLAYGADGGSQYLYRISPHMVVERLSKKGLYDGNRDWQTGTGRWDFLGWPSWGFGVVGGCLPQSQGLNNVKNLADTYAGPGVMPMPNSAVRATLPLLDRNKWPMLGISFADIGYVDNDQYDVASLYRPRGGFTEGLFTIQRGGWASGDELTDIDTGKKYKLFEAPYTLVVPNPTSNATLGVALEMF